jgi:CRP/FNR family cyclic AMP-dependent transcriptional regulator
MDTREALAKAPIFSDLKQSTLKSIARAAKIRRFAAGELLVTEGEEAAAFFVLSRGQAEVVKALGQDKERALSKLTEGDFFGEMALFDGYPRSATVRAVSECECVVLARWDLLALIRTSPDVALAILPVLSRRLRECEEQLLP